MRLLLLSSLRAQTGNGTTGRRIQCHLEASGHTCDIKHISDCQPSVSVSDLLTSENYDAALGVHLYRSSRFLQGGAEKGVWIAGRVEGLDEEGWRKHSGGKGSGVPFGIIFGGTDINEDAKCEQKARVMGEVLAEARFAVSFTKAMKEKAEAYWPDARNKIHVQPQGIVTSPNIAFDWKHWLQGAGISPDCGDLRLFLLVCGLRKVKDPLYLVDAFAEWHREEPNVHLIIIGAVVDPVFAEEVREKVKRLNGVHLFPELPQDDLHAVVKRSFAAVNSSVSEGMSAAILEAMDLNVPVLARNISGNAAIITHKSTGLLYSSPQEFIQLSRSLVANPSLRREIIIKAKEYITKHHSWEDERNTYQNLVLSLR